MTKSNLRAHEVEYSFDTLQEYDSLPDLQKVAPVALTTEEFIQKRKSIIDKLIDMSVDPE